MLKAIVIICGIGEEISWKGFPSVEEAEIYVETDIKNRTSENEAYVIHYKDYKTSIKQNKQTLVQYQIIDLEMENDKRKRFQDYKEQIRIGDRYDSDEYQTTTLYFSAPREILKFVDSDYLKKHPEATHAKISLEYPSDMPEVSHASVSISPTNKQGSILLWYDVSLYSSDVEMLFQIARDYYQQEKDKNCWYEERWYEEDLEAALQYHDIPVTKQLVELMKEECMHLFDDKSDRNEMLQNVAEGLKNKSFSCFKYCMENYWGYPVYRLDDKEVYALDLSMGKNETPELYWCSPRNDPDGEPDYPLSRKEMAGVVIQKKKEHKKTREEMKFILVKSIAAGEYQDGKRSVEWLDLASGIHNIKLTKALLEELKQTPMDLVFDPDFGWCKKEQRDAKKALREQWNLFSTDKTFYYQMLSRLQQDCNYYLFTTKSSKVLWAHDEEEQIEIMKHLYLSFYDWEKPEWISMSDIEDFEKQMCHKNE